MGAGLILLVGSKLYLPKTRLNTTDHRKIIAAGFAFFIHLFTYAYSAHHTSIAHLMLIFSLNPVTTAIGSWIFFKEKMTRVQMLSYILALLGIYILAREKQGTSEIIGDAIAMVSAIAFSAYALLSHWARHNIPNIVFASRMYLVGSFFFFITLILFGPGPIAANNSKGWIAITLLTLFPTLLGHGIFTFVIKHIPLPILSIGKLLEPGLAAITAFFIFHESLSPAALASSILIFISVILIVTVK